MQRLHRLPLLAHRVAAAFRADGRRLEGLAVGGALFLDRPDDLGDHVARPLHHHRVAGADVPLGDHVLVVQRRAGDGDAADMHRFQLGNRGERPGAPDRDRNAVQHGFRLLGRELAGDRPARRAAGGAEARLPVEAVDLEDHAVDFEVQAKPFGLDLAIERARLVEAVAAQGVGGEREPPFLEPREHVALLLAQRRAHLTPAVGEEAQPALSGERRIDLA